MNYHCQGNRLFDQIAVGASGGASLSHMMARRRVNTAVLSTIPTHCTVSGYSNFVTGRIVVLSNYSKSVLCNENVFLKLPWRVEQTTGALTTVNRHGYRFRLLWARFPYVGGILDLSGPGSGFQES